MVDVVEEGEHGGAEQPLKVRDRAVGRVHNEERDAIKAGEGSHVVQQDSQTGETLECK